MQPYYDPDAPADVYIATQGGTKSGGARVLWRMTVADAMAVCSHPRTIGRGRGGEWMLCWTTHQLMPITGALAEAELFSVDDGRFAALFAELSVEVLASRATIMDGTARVMPVASQQAAPARPAGATQLDLFGNEEAA